MKIPSFKGRGSYTPTRDRAAEVIAIQHQVQTIARGVMQELGRLEQILSQIEREEAESARTGKHRQGGTHEEQERGMET